MNAVVGSQMFFSAHNIFFSLMQNRSRAFFGRSQPDDDDVARLPLYKQWLHFYAVAGMECVLPRRKCSSVLCTVGFHDQIVICCSGGFPFSTFSTFGRRRLSGRQKSDDWATEFHFNINCPQN